MTVTSRNIIRFGGSKAVVLPADWFRTFKLKAKQKMIVAYGNIVLISPSSHIEKEFTLKEMGRLIDQINKWGAKLQIKK